MTILDPMTDAEFDAFVAESVPAYARDTAAAGGHEADAAALEKSRSDLARLLPDGRRTPGQFLYTLRDDAGADVGALWFGVQERSGQRIAFVYQITIRPEHRRRGHATRAFRALEEQTRAWNLAGIGLHVFGHNTGAQALYQRLGYAPTSIQMYKTVGATAGASASEEGA